MRKSIRNHEKPRLSLAFSRWDLYKRGLLEEIRSWSSAASRGIVDREDPVPMIGGSALEEEVRRPAQLLRCSKA